MTGIETLLKGVSADRMMEHLGELARFVKLSGTGAEMESLRLLRARLDEIEYSTEILLHDAWISLPGAARLAVTGREIPCITHSMSAPAKDLVAECVWVGEGTEADFAGLDLHGKVAVVEGIALEDVTRLARRAGAVAQIQIDPTASRHEMCISPVWGSPGLHDRQALPTTVVVTVSGPDGASLRAACKKGERPLARIGAEVETGWRKIPILVAEMGCQNDAPFVMLSGHHDTWHFGVMDNGCANATMVEVARLLAGCRADWQRGLRLCFWSGHSHGRYAGSAWYADEHWDELAARCVAHVNVDSTGGRGADLLTRSGTSAQLAGIVADAVTRETGQRHEGRRQGRAADQSFWGIGIASCFGSISHWSRMPPGMPVALGPFWHTPDDLIEHVDPANLARDTRIVLDVVSRLVLSPVAPLDHLRWCDEFSAELETIAAALGPRMEVAPLRDRLEELRAALRATEDAPDAIRTDVARIAAQGLIPIDHVDGDRHVPDPALPRKPWGRLDPLRCLASASADLEPFARVDAKRCLNRLSEEMRRAVTDITTALGPLHQQERRT